MHEDVPTTDVKEAKIFWCKIWGKKEHDKMAEWINKMKKELKGRGESSEADLHLKLLRTILKCIKLENSGPWWHTPILVQKFMSVHDRLALELSRC